MCVDGSGKEISQDMMRFLFVSKSLGTVSAGWLADALEKEKTCETGNDPSYFHDTACTDLPSIMQKGRCIVISGELDRYLERKEIKKIL